MNQTGKCASQSTTERWSAVDRSRYCRVECPQDLPFPLIVDVANIGSCKGTVAHIQASLRNFENARVTRLSQNMDDFAGSPVPLIELRYEVGVGTDDAETSRKLVNALKSSGFFLVRSPCVPRDLQDQALQATRDIFESHSQAQTLTGSDATYGDSGDEKIVTHPTDPKLYVMLGSPVDISGWKNITPTQRSILSKYWAALEALKVLVLKCIAIGLDLPSSTYFVDLHKQNNSALRLLSYPPLRTSSLAKPVDDATDNHKAMIRCKPHSDYGSITLLLTDGVPGLQALIKDKWTMIPYVPGALVVNIGSLLSDWTNGELLATLHRVVFLEEAEGSTGNTSTTETSSATTDSPRISLAFFADPDKNVATNLRLSKNGEKVDPKMNEVNAASKMSVADYIQYRSGGDSSDTKRSGVAYTYDEGARAWQAEANKKQKVSE